MLEKLSKAMGDAFDMEALTGQMGAAALGQHREEEEEEEEEEEGAQDDLHGAASSGAACLVVFDNGCVWASVFGLCVPCGELCS